ncbi:MAG: NAD(P)-dependent oxidoreductase [Phycisphaerales bacterium]|nr:MAG: NAD(P)-dependent oxidoreductase [Phycisphaerales bacterium]
MHVALTGASGFIGSTIARHLHEAGHTVAGLLRSSSRGDHVEPYLTRLVIGDQADETVWPELLEGAQCLIHNSVDWEALRSGDLDRHLQSNLAGSLKLFGAARDRQLVFISSVAVHHDMRPRWEGRVDEDHPTRPASLYGALKAALEAHLWAAHFERGQHTASLRPCAVYGIDPALRRSIGYSIVKQLQEGKAFTRTGGGKFVHVDDVAAAVCAVVGNPEANGRVFNLADCYARWADLAVMARDFLGVEVEIDLSSPSQPKNQFTKDAARSLGVELDRGQEGIRDHLRELIEVMNIA